MGARFPTGLHVAALLFLFSFVLYLLSMSWKPFPGLPTYSMMKHVKLEVVPSTLDSLWGWGVRAFAHLPGLPLSAWLGLFCAFCGAASVALLGYLMTRVGYLIRNEPGPRSFMREAQARRLSGFAGGLFLACSIPFWMSSTRSLPETFHLLFLLLTALMFSQFQHGGKKRYLFAAGLIYGVGITEYTTLIVLLPVSLFLILREMFRWRCLGNWRAHLSLWGGLFLGLSVYLFNAYAIYREGAWISTYGSVWDALWAVWSAQWTHMLMPRRSIGFPVVMFFVLVPWLTLFAMSLRSPWFFEWGQALVRLIFSIGLLAVLFDATFSPWQLVGLQYLMVAPYLIFAVCIGYMAGEFWIMGEYNMLQETSFFYRFRKRLSSGYALFLPAAVLVSCAWNWHAVDGKEGRIIDDAAHRILSHMDGRDILFSMGLLDHPIRFAVWEEHLPVKVISAPRTTSPVYLKRLAPYYRERILQEALWENRFGDFLTLLLNSEGGPERIGIIDMPDVFREFGYLVPDGLLYRLETTRENINLSDLVAAQQPLWDQMTAMAADPAPAANPASFYQDQLLLLASKVANNLAVMQAEEGDADGALETLRKARKIYPKNICVLMNLLALGEDRDLPEREELEEEFPVLLKEIGGDRWALAIRYGYIFQPKNWVWRGQVWAMSGAPTTEEASRQETDLPEESDSEDQIFLDRVYQVWGVGSGNESYYRTLLMKDMRDTGALMELCRHALRRKDFVAADAYMREAMDMGLPEEQVGFARAMKEVLSGHREEGLQQLFKLMEISPGDVRIYLAIYLLTPPDDPEHEIARKVLESHRGLVLSGHLTLASEDMKQKKWPSAREQVEAALQINSLNIKAWEMMAEIGRGQGNPALTKSSLNALVQRAPHHYLHYQDLGIQVYNKGDLAGAEKLFREGIGYDRNPVLLNNLAHVLFKSGKDPEEALKLVTEALDKDPNNTVYLNTRGEIRLALGQYGEAEGDFQHSLEINGTQKRVLLMLAETYEGLGDRERALKVAVALAKNPGKLSNDEKRRLKELITRLR